MAFPDGFLFGTANADHQVEAHDPEREDVWDLWERCQGLTARGRATDFWNRYEEDIAAAAAMGCGLFRFSTAWARVETAEGVFDDEALAHYRRVAECVRGHGMKVMLTLHHFVWPVWLERDHGGMLGKRFPELFARYAERTAAALGDLVDYWITFNEPSQLTFGYIRPWWLNRYYMPPGLPPGTDVDEEAEAVGKLVPNLFSGHAAARERIKRLHPQAQVGVNPLVTGFPTWLQMIMDWGACHRGLSEAVFKFTTSEALVREKGGVDLVIAGITADDGIPLLLSDPYLRTGKAVLVRTSFPGKTLLDLAAARVGVVAVGNQPAAWKRDLPPGARKVVFRDYREAKSALAARTVDAVYGDAFYLMPGGGEPDGGTRFLTDSPGDEAYAVAVPNGRVQLMRRVNDAVARLQQELQETAAKGARRPLSISEALFLVEAPGGEPRKLSRGLRRILKRGRLRVGMRVDTPENGLEMKLARLIAREVLGDENALELVELEPAARMSVLRTKSRWLNWAWRFWGTTSLIANANWWYLGMSGRLPEELCPREAVGAQDFVGLDYYWGLPTSRLHEFRSLEDAAHGRFLRAPVWPRGLYHALKRLHRWFPDQPLYVVENGSVPEADGVVRKQYLRLHLAEVEAAIREGVPVAGYNLWSITSNREWGHAFDPNTDFGLYFIDLDKDSALRRVPTGEVEFYRGIIRGGGPRADADCSNEG